MSINFKLQAANSGSLVSVGGDKTRKPVHSSVSQPELDFRARSFHVNFSALIPVSALLHGALIVWAVHAADPAPEFALDVAEQAAAPAIRDVRWIPAAIPVEKPPPVVEEHPAIAAAPVLKKKAPEKKDALSAPAPAPMEPPAGAAAPVVPGPADIAPLVTEPGSGAPMAAGSSTGTPGGTGEPMLIPSMPAGGPMLASAAPVAAGGELDGVDIKSLLRGYVAEVSRLLNREFEYPVLALRAQLEGTVVVAVEINAHGEIVSVQVARSSGHRILDDAAVESVNSFGRLPAPPAATGWKSRVIQAPFVYRIRR
ncbi:MAG: hypothetical protein GMKNLPBB_01565 [Myxococcota bacterium]|nr:hypothetical protein [Myxococcota bacterium]